MRPRLEISGLLLSCLFVFAQPLFCQTHVAGPPLSYYWLYKQLGTCPMNANGGNPQPIYEYDYYDIDPVVNGTTYSLNATTAYLVSPGGTLLPAVRAYGNTDTPSHAK